MGNLKMSAIGIGVIFLITIIVVVIWNVYDMTNPEYKRVYKEEQKETEQAEQQAIEIVQKYQGEDQKGENTLEALSIMINIAYQNEDIFNNPSTIVEWYTFEDFTKKEGVYQVVFNFETYREKVEYIWYVDTNDNNKIFAGDNGAKSILSVLNTFD
jgi:hypothetical protein